MTQHDAKNAVVQIKRSINAIHGMTQRDSMVSLSLQSVMEDIDELLRLLDDRKQAAPNCRPATREELEQLCQGGNVVLFPAAA